MPEPLAAPGVYITEIPSGIRAVTGVSTSVTAFVGRAARGPVGEPVTITSMAQFDRVFGGLWRESGLSYAVRDFYLNGGGTARVLRLAGGAESALLDVDGLLLEASGPGIWGNRLQVEVVHPQSGNAEEVASGSADFGATDLFELKILEVRDDDRDAATVLETFLNLTTVDGPRRVDAMLRSSQFVRVKRMPSASKRPAKGVYKVTDAGLGTDGDQLDLADYAGEQGLDALVTTDFNLLCLPPSRPDGNLPEDVWAKALRLCQQRRAFLLVDTPAGTAPADSPAWLAKLGMSGPMNRNGAVYVPRLRSADPLRDGAMGDFVPSGAVAGVMARTDATRGVWKAPAGVDAGVVGASGLTYPMSEGESEQLNPLGINCLRTFPQVGSVVWGARTLRGANALADEYKYVPVRRLALFVEESLVRGTQWVVFEPNDERLWSQIRTSLGAFMQDLFRQGAFQGRTPREAYFVACDSETTTQYDIDRGIVNIVVGFAPLKPTEFVVIGIQQKTAEAAG
ncbi:phage tail sheath subtilisin-like domain-containing protein [Streptomyces sp. NPDC001586]|uniref:phage tail sheath family protein n=1 Tax=unclassified Streptomyces TaxID=2593676 RepID=UPI0033324FC6